MRLVDLSMTVEECDSTPFAKEEAYFKIRPIVRWEDKGFVSNMVEMTVHAGTHIDSPHHFFRDQPSVEALPLESMMGEAVVPTTLDEWEPGDPLRDVDWLATLVQHGPVYGAVQPPPLSAEQNGWIFATYPVLRPLTGKSR